MGLNRETPSIWGFGTLIKGTSVMLWIFPCYQNASWFWPCLDLNQQPTTAQSPYRLLTSHGEYHYHQFMYELLNLFSQEMERILVAMWVMPVLHKFSELLYFFLLPSWQLRHITHLAAVWYSQSFRSLKNGSWLDPTDWSVLLMTIGV